MDEKRNAFLTVGLLCAIILAFTVVDVLNDDKLFSETENRILASRPEFSREALFFGDFTEKYEEYITDQFVGRDKWIGIKTHTDILLQKKDINGVYLGKDDYLIEKHDPEDYTRKMMTDKVAQLKELVERFDAQVMLVPTADNIITDKLPAYASYYDQTELLKYVVEEIGEDNYIDMYQVLKEHKDEAIYYRTDHHWTTLGACYGYFAWAEHMGKRAYPYKIEKLKTVSDDFKGTLHSRINIPVQEDSIQYFPETQRRKLNVIYDFAIESDSLYEESYLKTKNQYGYFLDDNHGFVEIHTKFNPGRTLFVIKDSYANCMIPFLTTHYENIYVVDLRYFNGRLFDFMEMYEPEKGMDVLVLYNCIHFLEEFKYY